MQYDKITQKILEKLAPKYSVNIELIEGKVFDFSGAADKQGFFFKLPEMIKQGPKKVAADYFKSIFGGLSKREQAHHKASIEGQLFQGGATLEDKDAVVAQLSKGTTKKPFEMHIGKTNDNLMSRDSWDSMTTSDMLEHHGYKNLDSWWRDSGYGSEKMYFSYTQDTAEKLYNHVKNLSAKGHKFSHKTHENFIDYYENDHIAKKDSNFDKDDLKYLDEQNDQLGFHEDDDEGINLSTKLANQINYAKEDFEQHQVYRLDDDHRHSYDSYVEQNKPEDADFIAPHKEHFVDSIYVPSKRHPGETVPEPLHNYTEHVAHSPDISPYKLKNRNHWREQGLSPIFNVITSDFEHEGKKTLYVHEIQSDLHQYHGKKDSIHLPGPFEDDWHKKALEYTFHHAKSKGYDRVMFAPGSVQYSNNGGDTDPEQIKSLLSTVTPEQHDQIMQEVTGQKTPGLSLTHTDVAEHLQTKAGKLMHFYDRKLLPTASKIAGKEFKTATLGIVGERGRGEEEKHDFPYIDMDDVKTGYSYY